MNVKTGRRYSYKPGYRWRQLFLEFISYLTIDSKETGISPLVLYGSQTRFLDEVCEGLDRGVRHFVCLKARQLGISTVSLAIDLFWILVHDGLQGALITDTDENRIKFRILLERYLESLPLGMRSGIVRHNKTNLVLKNGSVLDYVVAGGRKTGGGLGRSRAWNFLHATECSGWGSEAGYASMIAALAQQHPDRLYIFESTARGYNLFWDIWQEAQKDTLTQKAFFIGWWSNENYAFKETSREYKHYWDGKPDDGEAMLMKEVREQYAVTIKPEQLAWHRWMRTAKISADDLMAQEYPWTEEQAFVMTGKNFFPNSRLNEDIRWVHENKLLFKGYAYHMGENFLATTVEPVLRSGLADLRVWEEPVANAFYVMGVDPAYGRADYQDNHCVQIYRCYADCLVQVAEYASVNPETYQLAWVMAHLAGCFRNIWINIEVNGPGPAAMRELKHLRELMDQGQLQQAAADRKLENVLGNLRWYLYHRPDSLGAGYAYGWKPLSIECLLPTPDGWKKLKDVEVGDELFDDEGKICRVVGCSPVYLNKECYEITFGDGSTIVASGDHRWSVTRHLKKNWDCGRVHKLRMTSELITDGHHPHVIRQAAPLCLPDATLPVHPYVLGIWLGDGDSNGETYTDDLRDIDDVGRELTACGAQVGDIKREPEHGYGRQRIIGLRAALRACGVFGNKHIPADYLRASFRQRLGLLQGLLDSDGTARRDCRQCSFSTSNERLRDGFAELLRTLGMKAKYCVRNRVLQYKGGVSVCEPAYQFWFAVPDDIAPFRVPRKLAMLNGKAVAARRRFHQIAQVRKVASVPTKCIAVDSASHLFLVGDAMVPTHNTTQDNKLLILNQMRDAYALRALRIRSIPLLEEMQRVIQDGALIEAEGHGHDDRVFATALANKAYLEWLRSSLIANGATYEAVTRQERAQQQNPNTTLVDQLVGEFFRE